MLSRKRQKTNFDPIHLSRVESLIPRRLTQKGHCTGGFCFCWPVCPLAGRVGSARGRRGSLRCRAFLTCDRPRHPNRRLVERRRVPHLDRSAPRRRDVAVCLQPAPLASLLPCGLPIQSPRAPADPPAPSACSHQDSLGTLPNRQMFFWRYELREARSCRQQRQSGGSSVRQPGTVRRGISPDGLSPLSRTSGACRSAGMRFVSSTNPGAFGRAGHAAGWVHLALGSPVPFGTRCLGEFPAGVLVPTADRPRRRRRDRLPSHPLEGGRRVRPHPSARPRLAGQGGRDNGDSDTPTGGSGTPQAEHVKSGVLAELLLNRSAAAWLELTDAARPTAWFLAPNTAAVK
jgi:hypothetical protein